MSKEYSYEVGYETLQKDFEVYKKQTPRGVSLAKKKSGIYLQFKTPNKTRSQYQCNCDFSIDGMMNAVQKAHKVKEKLETLTSEVEFWEWYEKEIKNESQLTDDRLTFGEAIKKVENDFWSRPDRRKRKRDRSNSSDQTSWDDTYYRFYKHLPSNKPLNFKDIREVIERWEQGTKTYEGVVSAMKHLAALNRRREVYDSLSEINSIQTKFKKLQNATLGDFLTWREEILGITKQLHKNADIEVRKAWLWVFSMQVVYGLRISEVFAIGNLFESYTTEDGVLIPALNNKANVNNLIAVKNETEIGTTTKTGYRLARPQVPPRYPNLSEMLNIKTPCIPKNKPRSNNPKSISNFYNKTAYKYLINWNAPTTETHAFRHLANINGMQAGISKEIRAQSLGHTPAMNDGTYKKRQSTQTTIDLLLNSNQNAIDFVTALSQAKNLVQTEPDKKEFTAKILSIIYQKNQGEILELL